MWLGSGSVYPYQSPYIGDDDEHTESAFPFSVCSHLSPYIGDEDEHTETYPCSRYAPAAPLVLHDSAGS